MAYNVHIPEDDVTIEKEFQSKEEAHAYITSKQFGRDFPDLKDSLHGKLYNLIEVEE